MVEHQNCIVEDLNLYIRQAFKFHSPKPYYANIGYLVKPSRLIIIPLLTSMILLNWDPGEDTHCNFEDKGIQLTIIV